MKEQVNGIKERVSRHVQSEYKSVPVSGKGLVGRAHQMGIEVRWIDSFVLLRSDQS